MPAGNLDRFLELVGSRADRESVRLKTIIWNGTVEVLTMKLDQTYWPASQIIYADSGWQRVPVAVNPVAVSRTTPASP